MRFAFTQPSFIMGQYLTASAQAPRVVTLPDDLSSDYVALAWLPLDEPAAACHTRMRQQAADRATAELQAKADLLASESGKPAARVKPATVVPTVPVAQPAGAVAADLVIDPAALLVSTQRASPGDGATMAALQTA